MAVTVGGVDVSRETMLDLEGFAALVAKWSPKINLISKSDLPHLWERHITDSVQLYQFAPDEFAKWVDLGSGGGFPGIIMAILGKTQQPDATFVMIESDLRKATFLRTAIRDFNLNASVFAQRIEQAPKQEADVVSARALASLSGLLPHVHRHVSNGGIALLHKGQRASQELAEAQHNWTFELEDHVSLTDPKARVLALKRIAPRDQ